MDPRSLPLTLLLLTMTEAKGVERVDAHVDGVHINNVRDLTNALGWYGVNLFELSFHLTQRNRIPREVRIRARDIKNSSHLQNSPVGYLLQFGYFEMVTEKTEAELIGGDYFIDQDDLSGALRKMQRFHGLRKTGSPSVETQSLMMRSRCGVKDVEHHSLNRADQNFVSEIGQDKNTLKYWFDPEKFTEDLLRETVRSEIEKSLELWSKAARISFVEVGSSEEADIRISFEEGEHGDGYPFYGPGGANSHVIPAEGQLHFDDAETFTLRTAYGTNLHQVAAHVVGHFLGLKHFPADHKNSVMYPVYRGYREDFTLRPEDKAAAVTAVGAGEGTVQTLIEETDKSGDVVTGSGELTTEVPETPPDCVKKVDAAFHWAGARKHEYVYLFTGSWYYRLVRKNSGNPLPVLDTSTSNPKRIGIDGFFGLPRHMDAAVESIENPNQFYVFKGSKYYLYDISSRGIAREGPLTDLWPEETPQKIDAAVKIDTQTLGFLVEDKLYEYQSNTQKWKVGCDGSNYFRKFTELDSLSLGFLNAWAWIFQGAWYSVARNRNGWEPYNYMLRSIKADLKLPMCTQQVGSLPYRTKRRCVKELKKMKQLAGSFEPSPDCKDFIVDRYNIEVQFDMSDFE